ncbi:MAG: hypothetical protein J7501_17105 [Bdellovibrio sp.]|nr:hypothetical protein [Bdellovibrio sp.]
MAKILWFYPGISLSQYGKLDLQTLSDLWESITIIEAQQMINQQKVVMAPKMKAKAREEFIRSLHEKAFPSVFEREQRALKPEQMTQFIGKKGKANGGK